MENSFAQISELFAQFSENAKLQIEKGNKAAGMRARKASLELEKLLKRITGSLQMIPFGIRTYQVSSKKPLRFTAERLLVNNRFSMAKTVQLSCVCWLRSADGRQFHLC
jgi:hypothetical protein